MKNLTDYFNYKPQINLSNPKLNFSATSEQSQIINAELNKNIVIIACAGSGKTTTLVQRIKYLIDNGIDPYQIILTTFTREASADMKKKLKKVLGENGVYVGTMDSLSRYFLNYYEELDETMKNVGEFALHFLKFLREDEKRFRFFSTKKYLFVDEFQDINQLQFEIIQEFYKNNVIITGVGDDAQNIYTFRGSDIKYILNFQKYFDNSECFLLSQNFRSTKQIVDIANESISKTLSSYPKKMFPQPNFKNQKPEIRFFYNQEEQGNFIFSKIHTYKKSNISLDKIAILCPINFPLYFLEEMSLKLGFQVVVLDSKSEAKGNLNVSMKKGSLTLATIHKSKGLEWDIVFVIGMNDELFPPEKELNKIEEARRLFYVATTRAKKHLYFTFSSVNSQKKLTRFLSEIPREMFYFPNFSHEFLELSQETHIIPKTGVMEKIETLQIEDISYLRQKRIIPTLYEHELEIIEVHGKNVLPKFVYDQNLFSDYGIFIDLLLSREMMFQLGKPLKLKCCAICLSAIKLDLITYKFYLNEIDKITEFLKSNQKLHKPKLEFFDRCIINLMIKIYDNAEKYHLKPWEVLVIPKSFLSKEWNIKIKESYLRFKSKGLETEEIIEDIWNVSLTQKIVNEGRRKMLYLKHPIKKIRENGLEFLKNFQKFLPKLIGDKILIHQHYSIEDLCGEIDFIIDDKLFDIKVSHEKSVDLNWILQLMSYRFLYENETETPINEFFIYNVLSGQLIKFPLINIKPCQKLCEYLQKKK